MTWRDDYHTNDEAGAAAWEWNHTLPADDAPGWADLYVTPAPDCCPDPAIAAARLCGCW